MREVPPPPEGLVGATEPRLETPRPPGPSLGQDVVDVAAALGHPIDRYPHQVLLADRWTVLREDGTWAWLKLLLEIARQNGKTSLTMLRVLTGLLVWGERTAVIAAQKLTLAVEVLEEAEQLLADHLPDELHKLHRTNGRERLELTNGAVWHARAANATAARGLKAVDVLWIDEVRDVSEAAWDALHYTQRAALGALVGGVRLGPQTIATSNAGHSGSALHRRLLEEGLRGLDGDTDGDLHLASYSAPPTAEVTDWHALAQANPMLGRRITQRQLASEVRNEREDALRTEVLCQWVDAMESPWPEGAWEACADPELELVPGAPTWLAIDTTPDRSTAALVIGQRGEDGTVAARLLSTWHAEHGAVDQLRIAGDVAQAVRTHGAQLVAFDRWTSGAVAARLESAGIPTADCSGGTFAQACDELLDAMASGRLVHADQDALTQHVADCARKPAADGGWRIIRQRSAGPVTAACALAMVVHHATLPPAYPQVASA